MEKSFEAVVSSAPVVLVDFYADWCAPCKLVVPILEEVAGHFKDKLLIHKVDIDKNAELAKSFTIMSVPTLILFKDGIEVWRMRGFDIAPGLIKIFSEHIK